ncbi:amino acid permease [Candidatus Dependentiae bacterium]|nr:amino acid permease [Candidatus Dependentiae bacterium]
MMAKKSHKMSLFTLIMISAAFTVSVRNLPTEAETGMHLIFFVLIAAIGFFIPVALVSAELATGWPKQGGIYVWVKEAFGERWGFISVWFQWNYMIIGIISQLYFVGGSLAFIFAPHLANSKFFLATVLLIVLWGSTFFAVRGQKTSSKISTAGFLGGVLFPGILLITLGIVYLLQGNTSQIDMSFNLKNLIPNLHQITTLVLLVGFMRTFCGIEASSSHASEVKNPKRNYPIAILFVVLIGLIINIIGSLSVAVVVPQKQISLVAGIMEAFTAFFAKFNMSWFVPIMGILVAFGAIGAINTWLMGPVKGLFASAKNGQLPPYFQKLNKNKSPQRLLILQAIVISLIGSSFLLLPNINIAFWISVAIAMLIYFTMYSLMFLAGIRLRYKAPRVKRVYKIPGGNFGMWFIALLGLLTLLLGYIVAVFPPAQLPTGDVKVYEIVLILGTIIIFVIPFIIYAMKKPSWRVSKK